MICQGMPLASCFPGQPPSSKPVEYDLWCDANGRCGTLHRVGSIRPLCWVCRLAVDLNGRDMPPLPQLVNHTAGERRPMRSTECFCIKDVGDLAVHLLLAIQLHDALTQTVLIGVLHVALHGTYHRGNIGLWLQKSGVSPSGDRLTVFLDAGS